MAIQVVRVVFGLVFSKRSIRLVFNCRITSLVADSLYQLQVSVSYEGDGDGIVGFRDFLILSDNFTGRSSQGGKTFRDGDFNGDGDVDFDDFLRLIHNWHSASANDAVFAAWPAS